MVSLNRAAKLETEILDTSRPNTQANIREMLGKLQYDTEADHAVVTAEGLANGTVADVMAFHVHRARRIIKEALVFAPFYDSEVVEIIAALQDCELSEL